MSFVDPRLEGVSADDGAPRCFYNIFAYDTDLGNENWLSKEWERVKEAAEHTQCTPNLIDRILVLNRGLIIPTYRSGNTFETEKGAALREWFLHLVNFISRENSHRKPVDLQLYSSRRTKGWQNLQ